MKINDKNLVAIATATNVAVDKEGWLNKRNDVQKTFQKRHCVLKGNLLFYFEKKVDKEPLGLIVIEGCTVELAEDDQPYSFKLAFHGQGDRSFTFSADSQEDMERWMKVLACASYDYIKLMVAELQKQVDELTEVEKAKRLGSSPATTSGPTQAANQRHNPFSTSTLPTNKAKRVVTFAELHSDYGKRVVQARTEWLKSQANKSEVQRELLISL